MNKIIPFLLVIIVLVGIAVAIKSTVREVDVPPVVQVTATPTNFSEEGRIAFTRTGETVSAPFFVYATAPAPVLIGTSTATSAATSSPITATSTATTTSVTSVATTTLSFDELSFCAAQNGAEQCIALNAPIDVILDNQRALVEGVRTGDEVLVRKLYILGEGEIALPIGTGSVFVTWNQAREIIQSCGPQMVAQSHQLDVYLTMKDGRQLRSVEPVIDEVFDVVEGARAACGNIPIATE